MGWGVSLHLEEVSLELSSPPLARSHRHGGCLAAHTSFFAGPLGASARGVGLETLLTSAFPRPRLIVPGQVSGPNLANQIISLKLQSPQMKVEACGLGWVGTERKSSEKRGAGGGLRAAPQPRSVLR